MKKEIIDREWEVVIKTHDNEEYKLEINSLYVPISLGDVNDFLKFKGKDDFYLVLPSKLIKSIKYKLIKTVYCEEHSE